MEETLETHSGRAVALPRGKARRRGRFWPGALPLMALLLSGCASPAWKGTPYYTTEPDQTPQAAKDRIPLWPLVYYRSPTLSVLGPIFELSDEYMALRPLVSVAGLDESRRVYSVLWPLGQFDRVEKENRFFPFFWGEGYAVGFPLYWHFGHPLGPAGGLDALVPLWWCATGKHSSSFNILWPVFNVKDGPDGRGWRLWPLVGAYSGGPGGGYYRFAAWPLAHQWSSGGTGEKGEAVLPLYVRREGRAGTSFYSLLYSRHRDANSGWDLVVPLLYGSRSPEGSKLITPLYWKGESADRKQSWQVLLPLYYDGRTDDRHSLVTLLGGLRRDTNGMGWAAVPLLAGGVRRKDGTGLFLSVPWSSGTRGDGSRWALIPPLLFKSDDGSDHRVYTPLYSAGTADGGQRTWQTVVPLWYRSQARGEKMVATLAGGWQTDAEGRHWMIWPLLSGGHQGPNGRDVWVLAPFFHARWEPAGVSHHLLPFYWWDGRDRRLISPLVATWGHAERGGKTTVVPPALTLYASEPKRKDLWTVAGAAHWSWGEESGSSHVLPFYYRDPASGTFLSLPWSTWTWNRASTNTLIAPALSWITRREERSDLWAVGPLAHVSWGEKAGPSHVLPFYYRNPQTDTFISLPYARWKEGAAEHDLYPPLLSMVTKEGEERRLDALLGLFSEQWGGDRHEGYFLPFYYYEAGRSFYTPLFGRNTDPQSGFIYPLTPLVGVRTGTESGGWFFPFWSRRHDPAANATTGNILWGSYARNAGGTESSILPLYGYRNRKPMASGETTQGKTFWSLPAIWYRNTTETSPAPGPDGRPTGRTVVSSARDNGFFPFWSYTHLNTPAGGDERFGSLLMFLYDHQTTTRPADSAGDGPREYVRRRVLWRFWNYERKDGTVSVDLFPAMTYDRGADGYRRWAFLWRAFRYETGPAGKNMDLLFIPVIRKR